MVAPIQGGSESPRGRTAAARREKPATAPSRAPARRAENPLRSRLRAGMDSDIRKTLARLVRPGDRVLEITASRRSYASQVQGARVETVFVDPADSAWEAGLSGLAERAPFDVVFLQGIVSYAPDIQHVLAKVRALCGPDTRLVLLTYNAFWQSVLRFASELGLRDATPDENWLSSQDMTNLLLLAGLELVSFRRRVLMPVGLPGTGRLVNGVLASMPGLTWTGLCDWYVARVTPAERPEGRVSVIVPARNEAGNISRILAEMPRMGSDVEVLFVEGGSNDGTWEAIEREVAAYRGHAKVRAMKQPGKGKKDAAFVGFSEATGDYLMILDADVTVAPGDLPKFYEALRSGKGEFINGTRLVYPLGDGAMRFLNLLGNRFFAAAFSFILGQRLKDTLCGTKALTARNWARLDRLRTEFGEQDPFGDFDLLFGASRLQMKIVEVPVRYGARTYGETNISRFSHGWMLLKMCARGLATLKFV